MDEEGRHHTLPTASLQESNVPSQFTINHPVKGNEHTRSRSERVRTPAGEPAPVRGSPRAPWPSEVNGSQGATRG